MFKSLVGVLVAGVSLITSATAADHSSLLNKIKLKPGFSISIYAELPAPRQIRFDKSSNLMFVGSRKGHIHSLQDSDGVATNLRRRAKGLNGPNGIAIKDSALYVGLVDRIARWAGPVGGDPAQPLKPLKTILDGLENSNWHGWRWLGFGPDEKLYIALGAPCNICDLQKFTGKIIRMNADGSDLEIVADGVRNSVGFDWHPKTGEFWFTDNGADGMGDDVPPDELNRVKKIGQHFGFPYRGGKTAKLTGYEDKTAPVKTTPPEIEFQAHTANLGIDFYTGAMFPQVYKNDAFVAQHGSWNRTEPVGYRIMRVFFDEAGNATGKEVFADGWLTDEGVIGRPVDIEELPDGSLMVTDDFANVIYRITYSQ